MTATAGNGAYDGATLDQLVKAMQMAQKDFSDIGHERGDEILRQAVLTLADYINSEGHHGTADDARALVEEYDKLGRHFDYQEPD